MAERIQAELARGRFDRQYLLTILANLGEQSAAQEITETRLPDDAPTYERREHALKLVRLRSKSAYPYVIALFDEDEQWQSDGMVALVQLASVLSPSQRREAAEVVKPMLQSSSDPDRWTAVYTLGKLQARSTFNDILAALQYNVMHLQEIVVGLALSELGSYLDLADELDQAFAGREGHICGAIIYAWGASAASQAVNPLARTLFLPDDYLRSMDPMDYQGDLAWACRDLRARAAFSLGWLAAAQGVTRPVRESRLAEGWRSLLRELSSDHPLVQSGVATLLDDALSKRDPARSLYNASLNRSGRDQELMAALLGAFEWSQVFMHMLEGDRFQSLHTWQIIEKLFSSLGRSEGVEQATNSVGNTYRLATT